MNSTTPETPDDNDALGEAFRRRRQQEWSTRSQPDDSATGTARVAERLAMARAEARRKPRRPRDVIDLT